MRCADKKILYSSYTTYQRRRAYNPNYTPEIHTRQAYVVHTTLLLTTYFKLYSLLVLLFSISVAGTGISAYTMKST